MKRLTQLAELFPHCKFTLELPREEYDKVFSGKINSNGGWLVGTDTDKRLTVGSTEFIIKLAQ